MEYREAMKTCMNCGRQWCRVTTENGASVLHCLNCGKKYKLINITAKDNKQ